MAKRKRYKKIEKSLVDVVIPVHNRFDLLGDCLEAIPDAFGSIPYKIIMVDNGSDSYEAKEFYDQFSLDTDIIVTRNSINEGFPRACNKGFNKGSSPLVFFLNSDVILEPMSGDKLVRAMDDPTIGIAGMKLLFPSPNETIEAGLNIDIRPPQRVQHVGLVTNIRGEVVHVFMGWSSDNPRVNRVRDIMAVTGAALMIRRSIFMEVGGFDEVYGAGCLSGDTYVFTDEGLKQMKDLVTHETYTDYCKIGLASKDGYDYAKLTVNNGIHDTLKVTLAKKYFIQGTLNHKVISMKKDGTYDWKRLDELSIGDYVAIRVGANVWGDRYVEPEFAYLLGLYTSEGYYEDSGKGRITITNSDKEVREFLISAGFKQQKDKIHFRATGQIVDLFRDYGVDLSQRSRTKSIPEFILSCRKDVVRAYLQGLFDGDGCAKKNGWVTYSSSSIRLINQVKMLLLNFGIISGTYTKKSKIYDLGGYALNLGTDSHLFYTFVGFRVKRKQDRFDNLKNVLSDSIPFQRSWYKKLYSMFPIKSRSWKNFGIHTNNPANSVRRDTISELLWSRKELSYTDEFKHLKDLVNLDYIWLKVNKIVDGGKVSTYDLHVPRSHSYVANGLVVHNTFEDVDLCMKVRDIPKNIIVETKAVGTHYVGATAEKYKQAFPLSRNYQIFLSKWRQKLMHTDWQVL